MYFKLYTGIDRLIHIFLILQKLQKNKFLNKFFNRSSLSVLCCENVKTCSSKTCWSGYKLSLKSYFTNLIFYYQLIDSYKRLNSLQRIQYICGLTHSIRLKYFMIKLQSNDIGSGSRHTCTFRQLLWTGKTRIYGCNLTLSLTCIL